MTSSNPNQTVESESNDDISTLESDTDSDQS